MARILVVDDDPSVRALVRDVLELEGHDVRLADDGYAALRAVAAERPDCVVLDVSMPGMDGLETAAHIKSRERTRDVPIIFLTAVHPDAEHAFRGYSAGAVDYVSKPFDPWVLRAKVSVFVELWVKTRQLAAQSDLVRDCLLYTSPSPRD